jgi:hypothetical protein
MHRRRCAGANQIAVTIDIIAMRLTGHQYLSLKIPAGKQPASREYGLFHSEAARSTAVCGAFFSAP